MTIIAIVLLSITIDHIMVASFYNSGENISDLAAKSHKVAYPILWGVLSFALMYLGMVKKIKEYRVISLSLFLLTLVKLFLYDIRNVPEGGKIAAFIFLGILLLVVSFMYQRLKKIVFDDEDQNTVDDNKS